MATLSLADVAPDETRLVYRKIKTILMKRPNLAKTLPGNVVGGTQLTDKTYAYLFDGGPVGKPKA